MAPEVAFTALPAVRTRFWVPLPVPFYLIDSVSMLQPSPITHTLASGCGFLCGLPGSAFPASFTEPQSNGLNPAFEIITRAFPFAGPARVEDGFRRHAQALKERAESLQA